MNLLSKKFLYALIVFSTMTVVMFMKLNDPQFVEVLKEWRILVTWLGGIYFFANVGQKGVLSYFAKKINKKKVE